MCTHCSTVPRECECVQCENCDLLVDVSSYTYDEHRGRLWCVYCSASEQAD